RDHSGRLFTPGGWRRNTRGWPGRHTGSQSANPAWFYQCWRRNLEAGRRPPEPHFQAAKSPAYRAIEESWFARLACGASFVVKFLGALPTLHKIASPGLGIVPAMRGPNADRSAPKGHLEIGGIRHHALQRSGAQLLEHLSFREKGCPAGPALEAL